MEPNNMNAESPATEMEVVADVHENDPESFENLQNERNVESISNLGEDEYSMENTFNVEDVKDSEVYIDLGTSPDVRRVRNQMSFEDDFIHSQSSIGSAGTLMLNGESGSSPSVHEDLEKEGNGERAEEIEDGEEEDTPRKLAKTRRSSVSTTNLPNVFTGSHRSIYTSIVLMPEQGAKWNQLAQRDSISKFCVIPVLEDQVGPKMPTTDMMDVPGGESTESSLESNNPLRTLLARRAIAMQHSELSPVAEMPFGSAVDINQSLRDIRKAKNYGQVLPEKSTIRKNFIMQCLSFFFVYCGYVPIRGMQTSLNHHQNLGSISISVIFASCIFGSLICPILVQRFGPKRTLCLSLFGVLAYVIGNLYASFYTLIPASIIFGIGFSILLGAQGAYQTNLAATYSSVTQTKIEKVLPFFGAVYFTFLQTANIVGNGLASSILKLLGPVIDPAFYAQHLQEALNETVMMNHTIEILPECGAAFTNTFSEGSKFHVSKKALYTLYGVMIVLILLSMVICTFFVDRLDCIFKRRKKSLWSHLKTVFSYHKDFNTWLLLCMASYSSFGPSLVYGDLVKAFVTCPIGVDMIGYAIVCYATGSALMSFSSGLLSRLIGPKALQYVGFALSTSLYTTMLLWEPNREQPYYIFILFAFLGSNDAIYQTRYYSLVGTLFAGKTETAFSFFLMYQSTVSAVFFAVSPMLKMSVKLYLGASFMALNFVCYTTLMLRMRKNKSDQKEVTL